MTAPRGIIGIFTNAKYIQTRGQYQLVVEIPASDIESAFKNLGHPNPDEQIQVAVVRVTLGVNT